MTQPMLTVPEDCQIEIKCGSTTTRFDVKAGDKILWESNIGFRCQKCNGTGFLVRGVLYCECPLGIDLRRVESRNVREIEQDG